MTIEEAKVYDARRAKMTHLLQQSRPTENSVTVNMNQEERERINQLCPRIITETDPRIFGNLVKELNDLLEALHARSDSSQPRTNRQSLL
jgi:hypothetical protein